MRSLDICHCIWYHVPEVKAMGKLEKLLQKIKNNPRQIRFEELDKILIRSGFTRHQPGGGSSHYVYTKGTAQISVPKRQPHILSCYVKAAIKTLEGMIDNE